jgi:PAS domain S-box-containing protein
LVAHERPGWGVVSGVLRVLIVDDSDDDARLTVLELRRGGYGVTFARVAEAAALREALVDAWDLLVCDWSLRRLTALEVLAIAAALRPDLPCLVVSATVGEETAVAAVQAGAHDFIAKGRLTRLISAVQRALRESEARAARRAAEEELRASEARYRAMFDASPQPMWVFDVETLGFLAVNGAAVRHYGYSAAEFATMTLRDIRPPEDVPFFHECLRISKPPDATTTSRHRTKDGLIIHVELRAHDFAFGGRPARLVLVNDVTERLHAQEALSRTEVQLRQAQKMEAIGRLAGGIAHDFNNMLQVILSYSALLLSALPEGGGTHGDVEEIQKAAQRAAELTRQLLAFSRQQVQELRVIDLNAVLTDLDRMLRRVLGEDIDMLVRLGDDLERVRADRGQVEQVVMNLVLNARDAMPRGGKLTLETANVSLDEKYARAHLGATAGPHVMLAVSDSGMGIDKATLERMFEPFFTTKGPGKGTGLGLATVHGIVQQSGGSVWVYSEPGTGTTFKVYFPVSKEERAGTARAAPLQGTLPKATETIHLVEDEESVPRDAASRTS